MRRNENILKYLVEFGADITKEYDDDILFNVCLSKNVHIVEYLVKHGADINKATKENGKTPFLDVYSTEFKQENTNIVKCLVEHGAYINKENKNGDTPLSIAYRQNHKNVVNYLLEHGADIEKINYMRNMPLSISLDNRHIAKAAFLNKYSVNRNSYLTNYCNLIEKDHLTGNPILNKNNNSIDKQFDLLLNILNSKEE